MVARRGTSNGNANGNSQARRRRKLWLLATFGDGVSVVCSHCPEVLFYSTLSVDRIVPGCQGGTYKRGNIQPACLPCNSRLGGALRRAA